MVSNGGNNTPYNQMMYRYVEEEKKNDWHWWAEHCRPATPVKQQEINESFAQAIDFHLNARNNNNNKWMNGSVEYKVGVWSEREIGLRLARECIKIIK